MHFTLLDTYGMDEAKAVYDVINEDDLVHLGKRGQSLVIHLNIRALNIPKKKSGWGWGMIHNARTCIKKPLSSRTY